MPFRSPAADLSPVVAAKALSFWGVSGYDSGLGFAAPE